MSGLRARIKSIRSTYRMLLIKSLSYTSSGKTILLWQHTWNEGFERPFSKYEELERHQHSRLNQTASSGPQLTVSKLFSCFYKTIHLRNTKDVNLSSGLAFLTSQSIVYETSLTRTPNSHAVQCTNNIKNTRVVGKNYRRSDLWRKERSHQYLTPKISERELFISTLGASWRPTMKKSWSPDTSRRSAKLLPGTWKKEQKQKILYERMVMKYHRNPPVFILFPCVSSTFECSSL